MREVAASADPVTRTFQVKLALPADAVVPLGSTAFVVLPPASGDAPVVIKLPTSALMSASPADKKSSAVWVFDPASSTVQARTGASGWGRRQPDGHPVGLEARRRGGGRRGACAVARSARDPFRALQRAEVVMSKTSTPAGEPASWISRFNLSQWALDHQAFTRYLMIVLMLLGVAAYFQLGQDEDPPFTFRAMVVRAYWPGATSQQVAEQVADRLEKTLQEVPYADKIRSYSKPGEAQIIFQIKDSSPPEEVNQVWYSVRKKIGDMRSTLPSGRDRTVFQRRVW